METNNTDKIEYLKPYGDRVLIKITNNEEDKKEESLTPQQIADRLANNVNVDLEKSIEKTESGLFVPKENKEAERFQNSGKIVAVGDVNSSVNVASHVEPKLKVGMEVMYSGGIPLTFQGETYVLSRLQEILYIIER